MKRSAAGWLSIILIAQAAPALALGQGLPAAGAGGAAGVAQAADPWSVLDPPASTGKPLQRGKRGKPPATSQSTTQSGPSWTRTVTSLAGVVGVILLLAWGYRAVSGGNVALAGRGRRPGLIQVVSRTSLSPRQSLCLVRVGPRMVLLAAGNDAVRALDVIDDPQTVAQLAGEAAGQASPKPSAAFRAALETEAVRYGVAEESQVALAAAAKRAPRASAGLKAALGRIRSAASRV